MDPDEVTTEGAEATDKTAAQPVKKPAPTAETTTHGNHERSGPIQLSKAEYERFLAIVSERDSLASERRAAEAKAEGDKLKLMAEKGQFEEALRLQKARAEEEVKKAVADRDAIQKRFLDRERALAVNDATAGSSFVSESAARQARQLLEARFDVVVNESTGEAQVVDKATRRPAADVAKEWLASQEASHFLAPKGKGGSPSNPGNTQADPGEVEQPENMTFEQKVMKAYNDRLAQQAKNGWELPITQQSRLRARNQA